MPRILLLQASVGTGHKRAADAIHEAFTIKQELDVRVEDTLDHGAAFFRQAYSRSYLDLSERAPLFWRLFYESTDVADPELIEVTNRLRSLVERFGVTHLEDFIQEYNPTAIICTHFLPIELLLSLKHQGRLPQPIYCVITDFFAHTFWVMPGIDGYFVGNELTRELLIARGVAPSIIHVSGIPVDPKIAEPKDPNEVRNLHNLPTDQPVVSIFGGGILPERMRQIVSGLIKLNLRCTFVVVAGRNEELHEALSDLEGEGETTLIKLDYIDYVNDLLAASDLVITKSGGLIVSETLARGTPMLVIEPIPGQEEWNADYVVSAGAGVQLRMIEAIPDTVRQLLQHEDWLNVLQKGAERIGRPRAALDIAEQVLNELRSGTHD
jgi:processive 1,2-diacylglycerol beta-glucosyltransferase